MKYISYVTRIKSNEYRMRELRPNTTAGLVNKIVYQPIQSSILERVSNDEILKDYLH